MIMRRDDERRWRRINWHGVMYLLQKAVRCQRTIFSILFWLKYSYRRTSISCVMKTLPIQTFTNPSKIFWIPSKKCKFSCLYPHLQKWIKKSFTRAVVGGRVNWYSVCYMICPERWSFQIVCPRCFQSTFVKSAMFFNDFVGDSFV